MKLLASALIRSFFAATLLVFAYPRTFGEINPEFYAVQANAVVQSAPPQITLRWSADPNATGYTISRKTPNGSSWSAVGSVGGSATSWTDVNVAVGTLYEYRILRSTIIGYKGTGYVLSGINVPFVENRGKVIFIVDKTHAAALANELALMQQDLVGDGWTVVRHDVNPTDSVSSVKNLIKSVYSADPANVKAAYLFGHVPVPYSGDFNPDGHPDHQGAWPADLYYGDLDGSWTDSTVNNPGAHRPANRNVPGDGKFDQSDMPSDVEIAIGRVDLHQMTCYANKTPSRSELDLLRAYLGKNHRFRHGLIHVPRRGLVCDNFGESEGEAFASSGWRNSAAFFGSENSFPAPAWTFFPTLKAEGYLWAYGTGGGSYYTCHGVGGADDFALNDVKAVFTMFLGSYFGDWDNESNFMRAALGSGYVLATTWAGRPHWFFHRMAMGEPISVSTVLSQNNRYDGTYEQQNWGTHQVHAALLGDPTLRMHPVIPPSNLSAAVSGSGVNLTWSGSKDTAIQGYYVYRANSANGPFTRISGSQLLTTAGFYDSTGASSHTYMVRAVKLESSGSGTYYNPSQGVFAKGSGSGTSVPPSTVQPSAVKYAGMNRTTQGAWKGKFGADGYQLVKDGVSVPSYAQVTWSGQNEHLWSWKTTDAGSLQRAGSSDRFAACWYASNRMEARVKIAAGKTAKVSFYILDWDGLGRSERIEVIDPVSGAVLHRAHVTNVYNLQNGVYMSYEVKGEVIFRFDRMAGPNVVISGIFFDPASGTW